MQTSHNYLLLLELSRSECVFRIEHTCFADGVLPEVVALCSVADGSVECWTECGPCFMDSLILSSAADCVVTVLSGVCVLTVDAAGRGEAGGLVESS